MPFMIILFFFFFQAEDGIRDGTVTGVQTCALPIYEPCARRGADARSAQHTRSHQRSALPAPVWAGCWQGCRASVVAPGVNQERPKRSEERRVGKECRSRWSP